VSPTVLVPVQAPAPGLDACLAALERSLPEGAPVLVADDACADPRVGELAAGWCGRTRLGARYLRRERALGFAGNVDAAFADVPEGDLVLLRCDGEPTPGWLTRLQRAAEADPRAASIAAWSGQNELAGFIDASAPATVAEARDVAAGRRTLVIADGNHAADHVLQEIRLYAPLIPEGCYFIAEDGIVDVMDWKEYTPGPMIAAQRFLAESDEFMLDRAQEKFLLTYAPGGFLKRIRPAP